MPQGIDVLVEDGYATIAVRDAAQRGEVAAQLLQHAPADQVQPLTRPLKAYRVPVEFARAAGLLDDAGPVTEEPAEDGGQSQGYDDGFPDMDWKRDAIEDYGAQLNPPLDVTGEKNKQDAIDAIKLHVEQHPQT